MTNERVVSHNIYSQNLYTNINNKNLSFTYIVLDIKVFTLFLNHDYGTRH